MLRRAPKRCFVVQLHTEKHVANVPYAIRTMGLVVGLEAIVDEVRYPGDDEMVDPGESEEKSLVLMTLDDGSERVSLHTPAHWIRDGRVSCGQTVDCVGWLRQSGSIQKWYANTVAVVTDPNAEILRWLEVSLPSMDGLNLTMEGGYPNIPRNTTEAFRLITVNAQLDTNGTSLDDLALVMQKSKEEMTRMLTDLQWNGQIYQNEKGNYVPL